MPCLKSAQRCYRTTGMTYLKCSGHLFVCNLALNVLLSRPFGLSPGRIVRLAVRSEWLALYRLIRLHHYVLVSLYSLSLSL